MSIKEIVTVVSRYLKTNNIEPNSIISNFSRDEHLVLHDDVDHIIMGNYSVSVSNTRKKK